MDESWLSPEPREKTEEGTKIKKHMLLPTRTNLGEQLAKKGKRSRLEKADVAQGKIGKNLQKSRANASRIEKR